MSSKLYRNCIKCFDVMYGIVCRSVRDTCESCGGTSKVADYSEENTPYGKQYREMPVKDKSGDRKYDRETAL